MAITGAHVLLYTSKPDDVRALFRDVFKWRHVDAGAGWLIFGLPPAEIGVHPQEEGQPTTGHLFSLMCDDLSGTVADLRQKGVAVEGEPKDEGWGITITLTLPGDLDVMLYQPRHPVAITSPASGE